MKTKQIGIWIDHATPHLMNWMMNRKKLESKMKKITIIV